MRAGDTTKIWHPHLSTILDCDIGEGCTIHSHVWIGNNVRIGNNVKVQAFAFIPDGVTIDDDAFIGPRVVFTNDKYPPSKIWEKTRVERGVVIGAGAVILPGVTLHEGCFIAAGAIVTKSVRAYQRWFGTAAKTQEEAECLVIGGGEYEI